MRLEIDGRILDTDEGGYLVSVSQWKPRVAEIMAQRDGIALGEDHWEVINFVHAYYEEYEVAPEVAVLAKAIRIRLANDKWNKRYLYELFPRGAAKMACRYAGLPEPISGSCV